MIRTALLGDIVGSISRGAVRLVGALALLIYNNETDIIKRSKHSTSRTNYDIRAAPFYAFVFVEPLTERKTAVYDCDPLSEHRPESFEYLRCKTYFGNEQHCLPSHFNRIVDKLFKYRGLAASRNAVQQEYCGFTFAELSKYRITGILLLL